MLCDAPSWVVYLFDWLRDKTITGDTFTNAINWLIEKKIIICGEII
jgi:hypothetical protein